MEENLIQELLLKIDSLIDVIKFIPEKQNTNWLSQVLPVISGIAGSIFGYVTVTKTTAKTLDSSKKENYDRYITNEKIKWLNVVRDEIANYISLSMPTSEIKSDPSLRNENGKKLAVLGAKLEFLLNPTDDFIEREIIESIRNTNKYYTEYMRADFNATEPLNKSLKEIERLMLYSKVLLKGEWEIIKEEAKGESLSKDDKHKIYHKYYSQIIPLEYAIDNAVRPNTSELYAKSKKRKSKEE